MNFYNEPKSELLNEFEDEFDYDANYDHDKSDRESDDPAFGADLAFCSPMFRAIFNED